MHFCSVVYIVPCSFIFFIFNHIILVLHDVMTKTHTLNSGNMHSIILHLVFILARPAAVKSRNIHIKPFNLINSIQNPPLMFQYSNVAFTKGRGKMSAMNGVLSVQHLSCSDKTLQYFLLFMFFCNTPYLCP